MDALPKYIMLGGWKWRVELDKELRDKEGDLGNTNVDKRLIRIEASLSEEDKWQTLFHESIHAALHITGQSERMGEKTEEGIIRGIENILWPWLKKYVGRS